VNILRLKIWLTVLLLYEPNGFAIDEALLFNVT